MGVINVNLDNLICHNFRYAFEQIVNCGVDKVVLNGGRNSTKSQVTSEAIIIGCMVSKRSAVAALKHANKIEERLVNTFRESIYYLGVEKFWKLRRSPFEYVLLDDKGNETDVSIKFTGCDNPEMIKSYKPRRGSFKYIWLEELTNFSSFKEVENICDTLGRGLGEHVIIMTYNPPIETSNWCNKEYNNIKGEILDVKGKTIYTEYEYEATPGVKKKIRQIVNKSSYLDVIESGHADWLGDLFIGRAEKLKVDNPKMYRWMYLGEVVGTDANVFDNIHEWDGDKAQLDIREVFRGLDWGYGGPDPTAYVEWYYDRRNRYLYALNEYVKPKMSVADIAFEIKQLNTHNFPVTADSANKVLNNELRNKDVNILDAKKGPDSVRAGIRWLQDVNGIFISKLLTPYIYKEFKEYEYIVDKEDNVTSQLKDEDNHTIDSTRYAFENEIKYG